MLSGQHLWGFWKGLSWCQPVAEVCASHFDTRVIFKAWGRL